MIDGEGQPQDQDTQDPAGDPAAQAGGDGSDKPGDGGSNGATAVTLEDLQKQIQDLKSERDSAVLRLLDPAYQEYVAGRGKPAEPAPRERKDPLEGIDEEKLAGMSNKQLIELAINAFNSKLQEELLPQIEQRIASLGDTVADQAARRDVAETSAKYKDFWEFKPQMVALSQKPQYANLSAEDVYLLAKAQSGKAAPAAGPVTKPTDGQVRRAAAATEKPTSGGTGASGKTQRELTADEAGEDAWSKVFGKGK